MKAQHKTLVERIKTFDGTVSESLSENTTHIICPRGVTYKTALTSLKISTQLKDTVPFQFVNIDWLPACIAQKKLVPTTDFEVSSSISISVCIYACSCICIL